MLTVTISECKSEGRTWTHTARTADRGEAIGRAIQRHFGKRAGFHRDNGLANIGCYGQITEPAYKNPGASNCVTGRVRIDVE